MANIFVEKSSIQGIADAIRECNKTKTSYKPDKMAEAIRDFRDNIFYFDEDCIIIGDVVLPNGITRVRNFGFNVTRFVIPDSVKRIDNYVCQNCKALTELQLGNGVETIGAWAFSATSIEELTLPASLKELGPSSFRAEPKLKKIIVHSKDVSFPSTSEGTLDLVGSLEEIQFPVGFRGNNWRIDIYNRKITIEQIVGWFNIFADLSEQEEPNTFIIGNSRINKLTQEQKDIIYNKNWILK